MIKYLQLYVAFDAKTALHELKALESSHWKDHYNKSHYTGGWTILPLRSVNGDPDNIVSVHASSNATSPLYRNTPLLDASSYLQTVINFFQCEKTSVRLMKLHAGAVIKEHTDHEMSFEEGEARFHIPITTNPKVEFYLDGERLIMKEGECWYLNLSLKHRVANFGESDRIHLVIDCKVNNWLKHKFSAPVAAKKEIDKGERNDYSRDDKLKIITNLRLMNTAVSNEMAAKMEKELQ